MDESTSPADTALGAILVGGRSRRMGRSKATLELGGTTLAERALATIRAVASEVVQVGNTASGLPVPCWPDARPDVGPAGGLEAALAGAAGRPVVVLALDTPFVSAAFLREALQRVAAGAAAASARFEGRWHPLCAVYAATCLEPLCRRLDRGDLDLQGLLTTIGAAAIVGADLQRFGDPRDWLRNLNTPEDLARARADLQRGEH